MATLDESVQAKNTALQDAIEAAQKLIDDPNATADDAQAAMDAVKQIENDIKDLQSLQDAQPEDTKEPAQDDSASPTPDVGSSVSEDNTEDDAPTDDKSEKDNTDENEAPANGAGDDEKKDEERSMPIEVTKTPQDKQSEQAEQRSAFNAFMRSKGEKREGLTSTDAGSLIPEEIIYDPTLKLETVVDLASLVQKTKVSAASGKYPILKRASTTIPSVDELEANPDLAKPQFLQVDWKVATHRGALPISQESLDDAQIDLGQLVAEHIQTIKTNTTNAAIATKLASFTAKSVPANAIVDGLKDIVNVSLDPAYNKTFVMTQSMYNELDKTKDNEGRYLLQDQISSPAGKSLFGLPVNVIADNQFVSTDTVGTKKLWVGDLRRAILFADRLDVAIEWVDNDIYGRIPRVVIRFDVEAADTDAGYMVSITAEA
ncbi:phage major capsid protein [Weissella confusa]|uniref:phage major capsid protein n=1 Tax=Weissella confusa TaxID=1583 RepID=UPI0010802673|nr:phage major capsid protein [Weissella confusa]MBA5933300.1 phage major capsid protein [Weissella confusa]MBJ7636408.1 phage major capsid protein [Weissella confusa]MCT8396275.1 phage major capsid protein [Weissella confusa]TGE49860.1 phage major capsid protein [Weissella confusa]UYY91197.1 phage major capsid protein [Weissella confusa]